MDLSNPNWQEVVRFLIKTHGTQREVERVTGVAQQHISAINTGDKGERLSYKVGYPLIKEYERAHNEFLKDIPF